MPSASRHVRRSRRGVRVMNVTRQQYRAARRLFRQNGGYALQWMKPEVRLCIASTLVQPPLDQL